MPESSQRALKEARELGRRIDEVLAAHAEGDDEPTSQDDETRTFLLTHLRRRRDWITIAAVVALILGVINLLLLLL